MSQRKLGQFELVGLLVEVAILIMGLVTIQAFVRDFWRPHEQISFANVAALHQAIESVCSTGQERTINFDMPQSVAFFTELGGLAKGNPLDRSLLPKFQVKVQGDPQFILYWQSLSPVYGLRGWDFYFNLPRRAFVYIEPAPGTDAREYLDGVKDAVTSRYNARDVIFPNLIIGSDGFLGGSFGGWDGDIYKFNRTFGTDLEKTSIKYRACGEGLCFKTRSGLQSLPLRNCKLPVLVEGLENPGRIPILGIRTHLSSEATDLNIASPCKGKLKITKQACPACATYSYKLWEIDAGGKLQEKSQPYPHCLGEDYADDIWEVPDTSFECIYVEFDTRESSYCRLSAPPQFFDETVKQPGVMVTRDTSFLFKEHGSELCSWPSLVVDPIFGENGVLC